MSSTRDARISDRIGRIPVKRNQHDESVPSTDATRYRLNMKKETSILFLSARNITCYVELVILLLHFQVSNGTFVQGTSYFIVCLTSI